MVRFPKSSYWNGNSPHAAGKATISQANERYRKRSFAHPRIDGYAKAGVILSHTAYTTQYLQSRIMGSHCGLTLHWRMIIRIITELSAGHWLTGVVMPSNRCWLLRSLWKYIENLLLQKAMYVCGDEGVPVVRSGVHKNHHIQPILSQRVRTLDATVTTENRLDCKFWLAIRPSAHHDPNSSTTYSFCYSYPVWLFPPVQGVVCYSLRPFSYAECLPRRTWTDPSLDSYSEFQ